MGKIVFGVTNFIGIRVERLKFPPWADIPDIRLKYKELMPELSTIVRPFFYVATSPKTEAAYIREVEGIPDLFPLESYPGKGHSGFGTIITMIGLYVKEVEDLGISIEKAYYLISQTLEDVGIEFNPEDIEALLLIPHFSIQESSDDAEQC